jgi:hypothetical protein
MQAVLLDIQLAEAYSIGLNEDSLAPAAKYEKNKDSLLLFYMEILKHHHLSFAGFNQAMDWYKVHPAEMDSLISGTIENLNKAKAENGINDKTLQTKDTAMMLKKEEESLFKKAFLRAGHPVDSLIKKDSQSSSVPLKNAP